jgi:hypothetical protein
MTPQKDSSTSVTIGDIDGDGDLDCIFGNCGPNAVYKNTGNGIMKLHEYSPEDDITYAVMLGDLDNDGDLDYIAGNNYARNHIYLNQGQGHFVARVGVGPR